MIKLGQIRIRFDSGCCAEVDKVLQCRLHLLTHPECLGNACVESILDVFAFGFDLFQFELRSSGLGWGVFRFGDRCS